MDSRAGDYPSDEETLLALPERREQNRALGSRRRLLIVGAAALLLALAIGSALIFRSMRPLRVAVVPLNYTSDDELDKAVTAIRWAALEALRNQRGIKTVASEESLGSTPIQIGKAVFADQVLTISIQREQGNSAQVSLERIKLSNGETLRSAAFDVPLGRQNRFTVLHDVVYTKVQKVFSTDFPKGRPPQIDVTVSEADYASFLGVLERAEAGHALPEDLLKDLQDLDTIMHTSPRFVEAPLLAARIELSRFQTWREPADLDKASKLAQKAQELAPDTDLRPLHLKVQIALARNQFDDAEKVVEDLERRDPGDPDILLLRADLAEKQDRPEEAKALLTEAVDQVHSWQNRYLLATFAARHGKIDEARGQLKTILRESPKNAWALEASGNFELIYGSSDEAEKIFNDLVILEPRRERASSNLAAVHALRGDFEKAEEIYQRVFKANSDHSAALINLAEVETALQKNDSAEMHYGRALELLTEREANPGLTPGESLLKAQCLVRLGRKLEAAGIVKSLREKTADDPLLLYQSALVLSLAGEQDAALEKAKAALRKGLAEHWFNVPGFDELRKRLKLSHWFPKKH
jgi:tetratricopeptide (TPR) repeat protein